jgi:hypothetical protein
LGISLATKLRLAYKPHNHSLQSDRANSSVGFSRQSSEG